MIQEGYIWGLLGERSWKFTGFLNGKFEEFKVKTFDREVKICDAVEGDFVCGMNSADADDGAFLDDSTYFVIKGKSVRVFRNERIIFSRKFERFPLSVSLSREILYISTVDGIYIFDIRTGAEGFCKVSRNKGLCVKVLLSCPCRRS